LTNHQDCDLLPLNSSGLVKMERFIIDET
jgi:hypothetical protein